MSKRDNYFFIHDMLEAIQSILLYVEGISKDQLEQDKKTRDAIIFNFEVIGEAAKHISKEIRNKTPEIDWKNMIGMRDKITHQYFGIDWEIVWITIKQSLPELKKSLERLNNTKGIF